MYVGDDEDGLHSAWNVAMRLLFSYEECLPVFSGGECESGNLRCMKERFKMDVDRDEKLVCSPVVI